MDLKNAVVIDVRTIEEFQMGHVPGSINIPLDSIPDRIAEIKDLKTPLIVCCASGVRSNSACGYLQQHGITDIVDGGSWTVVHAHINN